MKNKNGFTLIELLAVIAILAIITIISAPIVINVIEDSRKSTLKLNVNNYIDAVKEYVLLNRIQDDIAIDLVKEAIDISDKPDLGQAKVIQGKVKIYYYKGNYCIYKNYDSDELVIEKKEKSECNFDLIN